MCTTPFYLHTTAPLLIYRLTFPLFPVIITPQKGVNLSQRHNSAQQTSHYNFLAKQFILPLPLSMPLLLQQQQRFSLNKKGCRPARHRSSSIKLLLLSHVTTLARPFYNAFFESLFFIIKSYTILITCSAANNKSIS